MRRQTPEARPVLSGAARAAGVGMRGVLFALIAGLVAGTAASQPAPAPPRVVIEGGTLVGTWVDGIRAFKAIPYAAPPVGPHMGWP